MKYDLPLGLCLGLTLGSSLGLGFFARRRITIGKLYDLAVENDHLQGFREKNKDLMRHDALITLKNSRFALVRELVGSDPVAVFRFCGFWLFFFLFWFKSFCVAERERDHIC